MRICEPMPQRTRATDLSLPRPGRHIPIGGVDSRPDVVRNCHAFGPVDTIFPDPIADIAARSSESALNPSCKVTIGSFPLLILSKKSFISSRTFSVSASGSTRMDPRLPSASRTFIHPAADEEYDPGCCCSSSKFTPIIAPVPLTSTVRCSDIPLRVFMMRTFSPFPYSSRAAAVPKLPSFQTFGGESVNPDTRSGIPKNHAATSKQWIASSSSWCPTRAPSYLHPADPGRNGLLHDSIFAKVGSFTVPFSRFDLKPVQKGA